MLSDITRAQVLPREELHRQVMLAQGGDRRARERVIRGLARLVELRARACARWSGLPADDLEQEGLLGVNDAIEGWLPDAGSGFVSWALWGIRSRLSRYVGALLGRPPAEVARMMRDLDPGVRRFAGQLAAMSNPVCLDAPVDTGDVDSSTPGDMLADSSSSPEDEVRREHDLSSVRKRLDRMTRGMPGQRVEALRLRFAEELTLEEAGQRMGVSRESVRQHEAKALAALRRLRPELAEVGA